MSRRLNLDDMDKDTGLGSWKAKQPRFGSPELKNSNDRSKNLNQGRKSASQSCLPTTSSSTYTQQPNNLNETANKSQPVPIAYSNRSRILVNSRQKGNPLLQSIQSNPWEYSDDIRPDYVMGRTCCGLFLSLKYHNVFPNYIYDRMNEIQRKYQLQVLLVLIDIPNANHALKELVKACILADFVLMCAWTYDEAGKILDKYKSFENRSAEMLMDKSIVNKTNGYQTTLEALSSIKSVNKTDAITLVSTFDSLDMLIKATPEQLITCAGLGPTKAKTMHEFFRRKTKRLD